MNFLKITLILSISFLSICSYAQSSVKNKSALVSTEKKESIPERFEFKAGDRIYIDALESYLKNKASWSEGVTLKLLNVQSDQLGFDHLRYIQLVNGIPVENTMIVVHVKDGVIHSFNGFLYADLEVNREKATITEGKAIEIAIAQFDSKQFIWQTGDEDSKELKDWKKSKANPFFPKAEKVIVSSREHYGKLRFAYKINIISVDPVDGQYIYIDCNTGAVIAKLPSICGVDETGTAVTRFSGVREIKTTKRNDGIYILKEEDRGGGIETRDLRRESRDSPTYDWEDDDNYWDNANSNFDEAATDVHWGAEMTYDYLLEKHNRNSLDGNGIKMNLFLHIEGNTPRAFYDPQGNRAFFGAGSEQTLTGLDVVAHELGHGVTFQSAALVYQGETGALNESFSDILGNSVERYARPNQWSWVLGEDSGSPLRDMQEPKRFQKPDTYKGEFWANTSGALNAGGIHTNSSVQNYWYYLVAEGGSGINDNNDSYTVAGIGHEKAAQIAHRTLIVYLTSNANFEDARTFSIQAAADLFGLCGDEVTTVANAWHAVGVGSAYLSGVAKADFDSENEISCESPHTVEFINNSQRAESIIWDFGDGTTSTEFNPSHTYSSNGTYTVKLSISGECGSDVAEKIDFVDIKEGNPCNVNMVSNSSITTTDCAGTLFDSGGPDGKYPNSTDDYFIISPTDATKVSLTMKDLDIEQGIVFGCNRDYLTIYDGTDINAPVLATFCNNEPPSRNEVITSTGGNIMIHLHADGFQNQEGFKLDWSCDAISGVQELTENEGTLFPIPVTEKLYYRFTNNFPSRNFIVLNTNGVVVKSTVEVTNEGFLDISDLSEGVYYVKIKEGQKVSIKRIVIAPK